jgi:hypothetical protein
MDESLKSLDLRLLIRHQIGGVTRKTKSNDDETSVKSWKVNLKAT